MKKSLLYLASVLAIAGCAKETLVGNEEKTPNEGQKLYIIGNVVDTKTTHTDYDSYIGTTWNLDDEIGIFAYKDGGGTSAVDIMLNYKGTYKKEASEDGSDFYYFDSNYFILYQQGVKYDLYAYYPYQEGQTSEHSVKVTVPEVQIQKEAGNIEHLKSTDLLYGHNYYAWSSSDPDKGKVNQKVHMDFYHALSVLEISLTSSQNDVSISSVTATIEDEAEVFSVSEGELDIATGQLTLNAGSPSIKVQFGTSAVLSETASKVYMQITPGHAGKVLSIYASVNGQNQKIGAVKVPESGIPAGVKAALSFNVEYSAPTNFTDLSANGTANCYLVNAPGFYKFKATVKGNGVIPSALSSVVGGSSDIAPKSALILWYNTLQTSTSWKDASPIVVSSVELTEDGYIQFYTPSELVPGNVVIAAFAEEGLNYENIEADENKLLTNATMLWSWNIWVAEGYVPDSRTLSVGGFTVMDRNLGALIDGSTSTNPYELVAAIGNHYQWGRKDPFPTFADYASNNSFPCTYGSKLLTTPTFTPIVALQINSQGANNNVNKQMFGYELNSDGSVNTGTCVNYAGKSSFATSTDELDHYLEFATKHPYKFIGGRDKVGGAWEFNNYNWYSVSDKTYKALWGDGESYSETRNIEKSLYDPCPAGWRVMTYEAAVAVQESLTDAKVASNLHGVISQDIYYPHTGRGRDEGHFRIEYIGATGYPTDAYFWHSTADKGYSDYCYPGGLAIASPANYSAGDAVTASIAINRCGAQGLNIRCIKE